MFNKDKVKGFLSGIIITTLILTISYGEPMKKNINVIFNKMKVHVDGKLAQSINEEEKYSETIIYNNQVYIPITDIEKNFGKKVDWDINTNSIYIDELYNEKPDVYLKDLEPFYFKTSAGSKSLSWKSGKDKDVTEKSYTNVLGFGLQANVKEKNPWINNGYLLNQQYKRLKGTFCMHYFSRNISKMTSYLKVYGDEKLLYTSSGMKSGVLPIDFDIDINGVTKLKIVIESKTNFDTTNLVPGTKEKVVYGLADIGLYK
ncbi:NPCBM/NEW2 domain-containing protein [Lutibacter sp. B2]|nr:NPCBM/NEW2 domain-containing protein [Lutibacter sp. B2]